MIFFKKYPNRKIYSTKDHCYVTLSELLEFFKNGTEIMVVDNGTQKDITRKVIQKAIFSTKKFSVDELKEML